MSIFDRRGPPGLQGGLSFRMNLSDLSDWSLSPYVKYQQPINSNFSAGIEASASIFGDGRSSFNISPFATYQEKINKNLLATANVAAHYTRNGIGTNSQDPNLFELTASGALTYGKGKGVPSPLNTFHANNGTAALDPYRYSATLGRNYTYSFGRDENEKPRGLQGTAYIAGKAENLSIGTYNDALDRLPFGIPNAEPGSDQYRTSGLNVSINTKNKSLLYANDIYYGKSDREPNEIDPRKDIHIGNNYYDDQTPFDMSLNNGQDIMRINGPDETFQNYARFGAQSFWPSNALHDSENFHRLYSQYGNNNNINTILRRNYLQSYDSFHMNDKLNLNQEEHQNSLFGHYSD